MFAAAISGRFAPNFASRNSIVGLIERPYSHDISPSANMFFERSASRGVTPSISFSADRERRQRHRVHLVLVERAVLEGALRVAGLLEVPLGERVGVDDQRPPLGRSAMFVFSAAGFIATRTFGASPGVRMSWSAK
jgi:hypothetical protein